MGPRFALPATRGSIARGKPLTMSKVGKLARARASSGGPDENWGSGPGAPELSVGRSPGLAMAAVDTAFAEPEVSLPGRWCARRALCARTSAHFMRRVVER